MPVKIYGEPHVHKFCAVDIFWNIIHRQAISPVAKFHHVLGRGFMIQRVKLNFYHMFHSQSESTILHESIILKESACVVGFQRQREIGENNVGLNRL